MLWLTSPHSWRGLAAAVPRGNSYEACPLALGKNEERRETTGTIVRVPESRLRQSVVVLAMG
jgi:hypothetical protein